MGCFQRELYSVQSKVRLYLRSKSLMPNSIHLSATSSLLATLMCFDVCFTSTMIVELVVRHATNAVIVQGLVDNRFPLAIDIDQSTMQAATSPKPTHPYACISHDVESC